MYKYVLYFAILFEFFKYYYTKQQNNIFYTFDKTHTSLYNGLTKIQGGLLYELTQTHYKRTNSHTVHPSRGLLLTRPKTTRTQGQLPYRQMGTASPQPPQKSLPINLLHLPYERHTTRLPLQYK